MFFFGSGRYREQLKLLYKAHKVFLPQCILLEHRDTESLSFLRVRKIQRAAKAALQSPQSYLPQCKSPSGD